jgi:membrane protein required for colicin V production
MFLSFKNLWDGVAATPLKSARSAWEVGGRRDPVESGARRLTSLGNMTGADYLILLILLGSTLIGLLRGFVREAASLVFWILAIWAAWKFGPVVEPHLGGLLADPKVAPWVGRLVILVLVLLIGWAVGLLLSYFTRSLGLGAMDRVIGVLFGIVRGMVLVGLIIIGGELLHLNHEEWWNRSKLVPYGETVGDWLRAMVGEKGDPWAKLERLTGIKVRAN